MTKKPKINSTEAIREIVRITDAGKTQRTLIVCATIVISIGIIVLGVYLCSERPWWEMILATVLGIVVPSGLLWKMRAKFKEHISKTGDRTRELELLLDPERSTSGLNSRGETTDGL